MTYQATEQIEWRRWVTPSDARQKARHRWYLFPHSFTDNLVHALIDEWGLDSTDRILDPFVGAGTTLLAAQERGIAATGCDLSPLAVLASNTKVAAFSQEQLMRAFEPLKAVLETSLPVSMRRTYPALVRKALPDGRLEQFDALRTCIEDADCTPQEQDFFRLVLLSILPRFSHAIANGGWLRWQNKGADAALIKGAFIERMTDMLADVREATPYSGMRWEAHIADARDLPLGDGLFSAVITSPPYPNRHDYTRVFGIELMFSFLNWEENRALRYQSFHSHPESRPERPLADHYEPPKTLESSIRPIRDKRIQHMLRGYFLDIYLSLCEVARVCRQGAKVSFVVGNVRYDALPILVDEFTAEMGERAGLTCREIRAVRWRGNSAQQMGKYGRTESRESLVMFTKP